MAGESSQCAVLVCGLGSLGQTCLLRLRGFDVPLWALDLVAPVWLHPDLETLLQGHLVLGDMRSPRCLGRAAVSTARAVLLVGSESSVNVEAALQVRLLNPTAQIVVRSSTALASLGVLMERRLPGIAVVDPLLLTASAVAQALGRSGEGSSFLADGQGFEVFHPDALEGRDQPALDSRQVRPLRLPPESQWPRPPRGPTLMAPLGFRRSGGSPLRRATSRLAPSPSLPLAVLVETTGQLRAVGRASIAWCRRRPLLPTLAAVSITVLLLLGVIAFAGTEGWKQGLFVTLALLKGEYVDPVNVVLRQGSIAAVDGRLIAVTLLYSLIGTLLTSALVAAILDRLLKERLGLGQRQRLRRRSAQTLLVQGGALATEVSVTLRREGRSVVRVEPGTDHPFHSPTGEVVFDRLEVALARLGPCRLEAIALLSDDLLANLQGALSLEERWPDAPVVILVHAVEAAERLGDLLGGMTVVSIMDVAADAMVATAFGERVEGVLRINGSNLLLVSYRVETGDTLIGRSVSRITHGYGVNVVTLRQSRGEATRAFPAPEALLMEGDQMVVLADLAGLRRVEIGLAVPPACRVCLTCRLPPEGHLEVRQCLARFLGLAPGATSSWLDGKQHRTDPIDEDLAQRLHDRLSRLGVDCVIEAA